MAHVLLYGGTFDPVHHGHLVTCQAAREYLGADLVVLIPAWVSPHKVGSGKASDMPTWRAGGATAGQRQAMLRLAVAGEAGFVVDDRELVRGAAAMAGGRPSYTIDTVETPHPLTAAPTFTKIKFPQSCTALGATSGR